MKAEVEAVQAATPGAGLHRLAEERGADLLAVGSCGRSMIGRAMLGDHTRGALNGAPCAVAIAARGYAEQPLPIAKIGVAYNGSPESETALATARELASAEPGGGDRAGSRRDPDLRLHRSRAPAYGETVDLMLSDAKARMKALEGAQGRAVYGLAGEELASFSDEVDLLVVGSRSYGPVKRLVLGSTSDYLERHARCSLLVLPRGGADDAAA